MKKTIILLFTIFLTFPLLMINNVKANENIHQLSADSKLDIRVEKHSNIVTISHDSSYIIVQAITEVVDNKRDSRLFTYDVTNSKFQIDSETTAFKIHQLILMTDMGTTFRVQTKGNNQIGTLTGVTRKNLVEIEVVKTNIRTLRVGNPNVVGSSTVAYEFYFDFHKNHDLITAIEVDYIIRTRGFWPWNYTDENITRTINHTQEIPYTTSNGQTKWVKSLEENPQTDINADYVTRIVPAGLGVDQGTLRNFAIIRIEYILDGEFFEDDVIMPPVTPEEKDMLELLDKMKDLYNKMTAFISNITSFFTENGSTLLKVAIVVIALILLGPIFFILRIVFKLIKLLLKIPVYVSKFFKFLFVPKKKNERKWK